MGSSGEWQSGLLDVCEEPGQCICATFCPCIFMCTLVEKLAPFQMACCEVNATMGMLMGIAVFLRLGTGGLPFLLFVFFLAHAIKDKYGIDESIVVTLLKSFCCPCCYLLQMQGGAASDPFLFLPRLEAM